LVHGDCLLSLTRCHTTVCLFAQALQSLIYKKWTPIVLVSIAGDLGALSLLHDLDCFSEMSYLIECFALLD